MRFGWFGDNILLTDAAVRNRRGRAFEFIERVKCQISSSSSFSFHFPSSPFSTTFSSLSQSSS